MGRPARRTKRSFANLRKLPSGRFQVRYTGPDGERHTAPRTFLSHLDAEAYAIAKRRDIDREVWDAADDDKTEAITFGVYAARWLANRHVAGRPIRPRTREHYQSILDDHLLPVFGHRQLAAIKPGDVREWHADTLTDRPTMRSHAYSLLRTIFTSAVGDELVDTNPARIVGASRAKRVKRIRPATITQLVTLTEAMPERLALMVPLASWCALRFGEIAELRRADIDLVAEVIHVQRAMVRVKGQGQLVGPPKSEAGERDVGIPPHLLPVLEDHLANHVEPGPDSLLFANENGGHLQPSTFYRHWYRARDEAGRPDLRFHDLRHSGAVLAAATGASLAELMARLGHSTPGAAMRYQHAAKGRDHEVAALLSKLAENGS